MAISTRLNIPIFRNLHRGGSVGVGEQKPALAVVKRNVRGEPGEITDDETEKRSDEQVPLHNELKLDYPNTWPINSVQARQVRREFVKEGFRKLWLHSVAPEPVQSAEGEHITLESLREATLAEPNNVTDQQERPFRRLWLGPG